MHSRSSGPYILGLTAILSAVAAARSDEPVQFNRDIRPILSDRCFACHGPDAGQRQADLRFDTDNDIARALYGAANPSESELIHRIESDDDELRMPPADAPKGPLTPKQISLIKRWVEQGAPYGQHWSLVPPVRPAVPKVELPHEPANPVDTFIYRKLAATKLRPSPEAESGVLLRRMSFDLVGLPPDRWDWEQWSGDERPDRVDRALDRMLASPAWAERVASYWLDLVRYADTVGYHGDQEHHIWPYRDWVISAINRNMPFDQFTHEQLAGDLIQPVQVDRQIASGYNRVLQTSHEGGVQPKEYLAKYASDRVRNLTSVWLGTTMGCAECHDHKFDPFTQKDFYQLEAFFADIKEVGDFKGAANSTPTTRDPEMDVLRPEDRARKAELDQQLADLEKESSSSFKGLFQGEENALSRLADVRSRITATKKELEDIAGRRQPTMVTVSVKPRPTRILARGDWMDESGEIVRPDVPARFGSLEADGGPDLNRLDLARWLTKPDHPLTARVFVNRYWYLFFGTGLSKTLEDLGSQGEWPTHPELVDWLAVEFVDSGWDVKHLFRLLASSATYRQDSFATPAHREIDPENRLLARQNRPRLAAEMIRDAALATSGLLDREVGGRSVKPYQPKGYYARLNFPQREYQQDKGSQLFRRSLYTHWQRQYLHPMLKTFDAPSREECTANRVVSNTPSAALVLLNDPEFIEAARALAERALAESDSGDRERVDWMWTTVLTREPTDDERQVALKLVNDHLEHFRENPDKAEKLVNVGESARRDVADLPTRAAWTSLARTLLNLDEAITRY